MHPTLALRLAFQPRIAAPRDTALRLAAHGTVSGHLAPGACVAVQSGRVWLTQTGDANDYVIDAGQHHVMTRAGRVVIESFGRPSTLRVTRETPGARVGFP